MQLSKIFLCLMAPACSPSPPNTAISDKLDIENVEYRKDKDETAIGRVTVSAWNVESKTQMARRHL